MRIQFVVCSELDHKPLVRAVCQSRDDAERKLQHLQHQDAEDPEGAYWICEVNLDHSPWVQWYQET